MKVKVKSLSRIRFFVTSWTVACQASPSMGFSQQGYWSGLLFPSPGDLPNPGIEPEFPALQAMLYPLSHQGKDCHNKFAEHPLFHMWLLFSRKSCPTLCDPMDCSMLVSSVHRISWTKILEWVAISFCRDLHDPGIKLSSLALKVDSLPLSYQGSLSSHIDIE